MPSIATTEELKAYARDETSTLNYEFIEAALDAAEDEFRHSTMRELVVAGDTGTARVFAATGSCLLRIPDCHEVDSIAVGGTTLETSMYQLEPLNQLSWAGEYRPFDQVRHLSSGWTVTGVHGEATITVTAKWGWQTIPPRVKTAVLVLAKDILSNRDVRFGLVAVTDAAGIGARTNPIVRSAIEQYKRVEAIGIA